MDQITIVPANARVNPIVARKDSYLIEVPGNYDEAQGCRPWVPIKSMDEICLLYYAKVARITFLDITIVFPPEGVSIMFDRNPKDYPSESESA